MFNVSELATFCQLFCTSAIIDMRSVSPYNRNMSFVDTPRLKIVLANDKPTVSPDYTLTELGRPTTSIVTDVGVFNWIDPYAAAACMNLSGVYIA